MENIEVKPESESESVESPEISSEGGSASGLAPTPETAPAIFDIDSAERVKFEGREWSRQELREAYLRHQDYTAKTMKLSEERKYYVNLPHDLEKVRNNPALVNQFKSIYPKDFHSYLDNLRTSQPSQSQPQTQPGQSQSYDPELVERFNRVEQELLSYKQDLSSQRVTAINAELDSKFDRLQKTYPYGDEEAVVARAQYLIDQGQTITDKIWDALWKSSNERNHTMAETRYRESVKAQTQINQKNKDVSSGGAIPGPSAKMPRTIKEASELARKQLEGL